MGLFDAFKNELIDIIEWLDNSNDTLVYRFQRHDNEIKNGAQLIVREGQVAVFIREGQLADVFKPGTHALTTQNLPVLSTLAGWKYGFDSPFKAEVYFVSTRQFTDQGWGTRNPVMMRDAEFGAVRIRAFGTYAFRVSEASEFMREIVGTDGQFTTDEITDQLRSILVSQATDAIAESKIAILDLAANYNELGEAIAEKVTAEFAGFGLAVSKLVVENVSLPEEVEQALDKRSSMNVLGNMQQYQQFQAANAMEAAAENSGGAGGMMGAGLGAGMGIGMGQAMAGTMGQAAAPPPQAAPPPLPQTAVWFAAINGAQVGPLDAAGIQQQLAAGQISPATLLWKNGMAAWTPGQQIPELAALFAAPPPIPGAPPPIPPSA
ncbi:MAG TPA: antifreeze protein [Lentisphaeria bacterium]|nr:antifreeze protein [Lentisphaeria bacterium]